MTHEFPSNLGGLFRMARWYGRVCIFTGRDGTYSASIEFNTAQHTTLKAESGFDCKEPEEALRKAIERAQAIVDSVTTLANQPRLPGGVA